MSDVVIVALIAAAPGALAAVVSIFNTRKIEEVHLAVNSRLTQLLELTAKSSKAEGKAEQEQDQ